jgi:Ca2+-binding RTX toxin-like protein
VVGSFYEIYVMNADGTGLTDLSNTPAFAMDEENPAWSPDGSKIAFAAEGDVWVMNADGTGVTELTSPRAAADGDPSWSPDGSKIAYIEVGDTGAIWTMNPDGSGKVAIRSNCTGCELWDVAWSPDGAQIAFIEDTPGDAFQERLWVMNSNGTGQTPIVDDVGTSFDWGVACTQNCTLPPQCQKNPGAICGTSSADIIEGTSGDDVIFAGDGDDVIRGNGGNDSIFGGPGDDRIEGGGGNDKLRGDTGNDHIEGGGGSDEIVVNPSDSTISEFVDGGGGNDQVSVDLTALTRAPQMDREPPALYGPTRAGSTGPKVTVHTRAGTDVVKMNGFLPQGWDLKIWGGDGVDVLKGNLRESSRLLGGYNFSGGSGNDKLTGSSGKDKLAGGDGTDVLTGGKGSDDLNGGPGKDTCYVDPSDHLTSCEKLIRHN